MHRYGYILVLIVAMAIVRPSEAQLRASEEARQAETLMTPSEGVGFLMNTVFNPQYFKMSHAFEMTMGASSYGSSSLAMYTNSLQWSFGSKLDARADLSVAYSPFNTYGSSFSNSPGSVSGRSADVFLRNAQVAYRPSENVTFNLSYHRSPYGRYMQPYGYYRPVFD